MLTRCTTHAFIHTTGFPKKRLCHDPAVNVPECTRICLSYKMMHACFPSVLQAVILLTLGLCQAAWLDFESYLNWIDSSRTQLCIIASILADTNDPKVNADIYHTAPPVHSAGLRSTPCADGLASDGGDCSLHELFELKWLPHSPEFTKRRQRGVPNL